MKAIHYIKGSININSNAVKVWLVLTDPALVKQYMGTDIKTNWKKDDNIIWEGEHGGIKFEDKGKVLDNEPNKKLKYTYWSSHAGAEDTPENHSVITWTLENSMNGLTMLVYTRENIPTLEEKAMLEEHLPSMLEEIKRLAEESGD